MTLTGGAGDDNILFQAPLFTYTPAGGKLIIHAGGGKDTVDGEDAGIHDEVFGEGGADAIGGHFGLNDGGAGNDRLSGGKNSVVKGGDGSDVLSGLKGATLDGGAGIDYVILPNGGLPTMTLVDVEGLAVGFATCSISDLAGFNYIRGLLAGGKASFTFQGGGSFDFTTLAGAPIVLTVDCTGTAGFTLTFTDTPNSVFGGLGNDQLNGGSATDVINGNAGDDIVSGGDGDDTVIGGQGSDAVLGGAGNDTLVIKQSVLAEVGAVFDVLKGGAGDDTLDISSDGFPGLMARGRIDGGAGIDTVFCRSSLLQYRFTDVEILKADGREDEIVVLLAQLDAFETLDFTLHASLGGRLKTIAFKGGGIVDIEAKLSVQGKGVDLRSADNEDYVFDGSAFNDILVGGRGSDTLIGREGDDEHRAWVFQSGGGTDQAFGGAGNDLLIGGDAAAASGISLSGGAGDDRFEGLAAAFDGGAGRDILIAGSGLLISASLTSIEVLRADDNVLRTSMAIIAQGQACRDFPRCRPPCRIGAL